ncbi:DeoR/GlpR family DNA-binding transcription regulator [Actinospica durhamensis]|uniref:DeoR/GlpR family DNA-binding transcription regulator n=1 Tax=Actinospica durhamensis TaxID=1508375 RepID=UPI0027DE9984|nr:DeoR/GlpR family DNA-binding transcription regulator [Actinospica durhamensis]
MTQTDSERGLLAGQRRAAIVREVRERGGVRVTELVDRFRVSDMTIRRDLDALARAGQLEKVHGGAVAVGESSAYEPGFEAKADRDTALKEAIASAAAALVVPGSAIALSAGTTTYALAGRLTAVPGLTVVTNSIRIAERFYTAGHASGGPTVVLTGGVRTPSDALVGPVADAAIRSLHFDAVFLGSHGISPEAGLSTPNLAEAETNRALVASARRVVAVADHTKWGLTGLAGFARLSDVDLWITDSALAPDARETAAEFVGDLLLAEL